MTLEVHKDPIKNSSLIITQGSRLRTEHFLWPLEVPFGYIFNCNHEMVPILGVSSECFIDLPNSVGFLECRIIMNLYLLQLENGYP